MCKYTGADPGGFKGFHGTPFWKSLNNNYSLNISRGNFFKVNLNFHRFANTSKMYRGLNISKIFFLLVTPNTA